MRVYCVSPIKTHGAGSSILKKSNVKNQQKVLPRKGGIFAWAEPFYALSTV